MEFCANSSTDLLALRGAADFGFDPSETPGYCKLVWHNALGFFLLVRKWSAKSSLSGLAELKHISQSTFAPIPLQGFPGYSDSSVFGVPTVSFAVAHVTSVRGWAIVCPALEHVLKAHIRAQYVTAFRQTLFWNAGETLLFSYQYSQIYFTNIINPDFNPLPSPLSSTLPRGLRHRLASWELLTMRDNRL